MKHQDEAPPCLVDAGEYRVVELDSASGYLEDIVAICAGANHAFALDENGNLWAWGGGNNGVLGQNSTSDKDTPVKVKDSAGTTQNPALKTQH